MAKIDFKLDDIKDDYKNYEELCTLFIGLTDEAHIKSILEELLYRGRVNNNLIGTDIECKDNIFLEVQRRVSLAYLLLRNPDTFNYIVSNGIDLFHGTNANALPSILKYGLFSHAKSVSNNIDVVTGEKSTRMAKERDFISFTDVFGIAEGYAGINSNANNNLSFEVIICTTSDDARSSGLVSVSSDVGEIGIGKCLPVERIRAICVPSDKVKFVKKMITDQQIEVLGVDDIDKNFYYIEEFASTIHISEEKLQEFKKGMKNNRKKFSMEEIKSLTFSRSLKAIKELLKAFGKFLGGGNSNIYDTRNKHR